MVSSALPRQELLRLVGRVCRRLRTRGFLVGGPVRDMMLGAGARGGETVDVDIAVEGGMPALGQAVARETGGRFVFHQRFLTGTVTLPDSSHMDVCRTRTEAYARPGVLPTVKPAGIEADLSRRDFTVNAMAVEITPGAYGRLLDPLGGRGDVKLRVIRILHDRSFVDDPTRIFRAIRFAVRLGYEIEPWTLVLMRRAVEEGYPALLSPERVLYELRLICREPLVLPMMEAVLAEGLLGAVWSWRAPDSLLPGLKALAERRAGPDLLFAWLLSAMPLTDRFPVTKDERVTAEFIRGFQGRRGRMARLTRMSAVHRLLGNGSNAALAILAAVESAPVAGCISRYLQARAEAAPRIGGAELRALGLRPGPAYGRLLERVRTARLDGRLRSRKDEIACVRRLVRAGKV